MNENELWIDDDGDESADELNIVAEGDVEQAAVEKAAPRCAVASNNVGRWGLRHGREVMDDNAMRLESDADVVDLASLNVGEDTEATAADFFSAAFDYEPSLEEKCQDAARLKWLQEMVTSPEFEQLRVGTMHDVEMSHLATVACMREYAAYRDENKVDNPPGEGEGDKPDDLKSQVKRAVSAKRALESAKKEVNEQQDAQAALGIGGPSDPTGRMDRKEARELYRKIRKNPNLRKIIEQAGKFRLAARALQRQKSVRGADETVGITMGKNIPRLLTSEKARLTSDDDSIFLEAANRFLGGHMLQRELQATQPVKAGPVMILLDESGSMGCPIGTSDMTRIIMAKALIMAMCHVAETQRRWVCLVAWADQGHRRVLTLPPGKWDHAALLQWLEGFMSGGTYAPLDVLPDIYKNSGAPEGKTDILCLTDGEADGCGPETVRKFLDWKAKVQARFTTIGIGTDGKSLRRVSDEVHRVADMSVREEGIQQALSF